MVVVLTRTHVEEVVGPVARLDAVRIVDHPHDEALFALRGKNEAPLVEPVDVDAAKGRDVKPLLLLAHVEVRIARLGLEEPHRVERLPAEAAPREADNVELAALDLGMAARLVEVARQRYGVVVEVLRVVEIRQAKR